MYVYRDVLLELLVAHIHSTAIVWAKMWIEIFCAKLLLSMRLLCG